MTISLVGLAIVLFLWNDKKNPATSVEVGTETDLTGTVDPDRERHLSEAKKERLASAEIARFEQDNLTAFWSKNATYGFRQTMKHLVEDLKLDAGQSAKLEMIFTDREKELEALLARETSVEAGADQKAFKKICALLRNKGLREDLAGILTAQQLQDFDEKEATRLRQTIEARAYRDMADINAVILLTDAQKQQLLAALMASAHERAEQEADGRAFMSLHYGQMAIDVDPSSIRGLTNLAHEALTTNNFNGDIDSPQYQESANAKKAERIESEISTLRDVLDENQLARYREHLEKEMAW